MPNDKLEKFIEWMRLFFQGATDFGRKSRNILEKEYSDEMDNFMLICFADTLGIPLPISYYTLELLPYLAEDMEMWEKRILNRKSIWGEKWGEYDLDA